MENEIEPKETETKETENCDCKCGFGDILPKFMKLGRGELITIIAVLLFLFVGMLSIFSNLTWDIIILTLGSLSFIFFLVFVFAELFAGFKRGSVKLVNTILIIIATICWFVFFIKMGSFSFMSVFSMILILGMNAYWAYDIIIDFIAKKKELAAKKKEEEAKKAEEAAIKAAEEAEKAEAEKSEETSEEKKKIVTVELVDEEKTEEKTEDDEKNDDEA